MADSNNPLPEKAIDRFFMKMGAIFLNAWSSNFPTADAVKVGKAIWAEGLADLHILQIADGLKRCESHPGYPPSLGEFKRMALGIPTRGVALNSVIHGDCSDYMSHLIIKDIGIYDLKRLPKKDLERRIAQSYEANLGEAIYFLSGLDKPWQPSKQITDTRAREVMKRGSEEAARANIADIRSRRMQA